MTRLLLLAAIAAFAASCAAQGEEHVRYHYVSGAASLERLPDDIENLELAGSYGADDIFAEFRFKKLKRLIIFQGLITDKSLRVISALPELVELRISGCGKVTRDGLKTLEKAPKLERLGLAGHYQDKPAECPRVPPALGARVRELDLHNVWIEAEFWSTVAKSEKLASLRLSNCQGDVGQAMINALAVAPALEYLALDDCHTDNREFLDGSMLAKLAGAPRLKGLKLYCVYGLKSEDLAALASAVGLQTLELRAFKPGPGGIAPLAKCKALKVMNMMPDGHLTAADIAAIGKISTLEELTLSFSPFEPAAYELAPLGGLENLRVLDMTGVKFDGTADLEAICRLPRLASLLCWVCPLTREQAAVIAAKAKALTTLKLNNCAVVDEDLTKIAALARLEHLDVDNNGQVSDVGIAALAPLAALRHLEFGSVKGDARKLAAALSKLPELREIEVQAWTLTKGACDELAKLKNLRTLSLRYCTFEDGGAESIGSLSGLRILDVTLSKGVTDKSLAAFEAIKGLRFLGLRGCRGLTEPARVSLGKALPHCVIEW